MLTRMLALVWLLLVTGFVAGDAVIDLDKRSHNRSDQGVCLWNCVEMIGKQFGVKPLASIVDQVIKTGVGFKGGASKKHLDHWAQQFGLAYEYRELGKKDVAFVQRFLKRNLPVIVSFNQPGSNSYHAVLLLGLDKNTARYINPNHADDIVTMARAKFDTRWNGRAYAIDPTVQDATVMNRVPGAPMPARVAVEPTVAPPAVKQAETLLPTRRRLMLADVLNKTVTDQAPRVEVQVPAVPGQQPYTYPWLVPVPYPKQPSAADNQNLGDGVNRPSHTVDSFDPYEFLRSK